MKILLAYAFAGVGLCILAGYFSPILALAVFLIAIGGDLFVEGRAEQQKP